MNECIVPKEKMEEFRKQARMLIEKSELIRSGVFASDAKADNPISKMVDEFMREHEDEVHEYFLNEPADLGVWTDGKPRGMLVYEDKEE